MFSVPGTCRPRHRLLGDWNRWHSKFSTWSFLYTDTNVKSFQYEKLIFYFKLTVWHRKNHGHTWWDQTSGNLFPDLGIPTDWTSSLWLTVLETFNDQVSPQFGCDFTDSLLIRHAEVSSQSAVQKQKLLSVSASAQPLGLFKALSKCPASFCYLEVYFITTGGGKCSSTDSRLNVANSIFTFREWALVLQKSTAHVRFFPCEFFFVWPTKCGRPHLARPSDPPCTFPLSVTPPLYAPTHSKLTWIGQWHL